MNWIKFTEQFPPSNGTKIIIAVKNKNKPNGIWLYDVCEYYGGDIEDNDNWCEKMKLEHRSENKFLKGTLVRVAGAEGTAIVEYTYAERYGGRDFKSYCLTFYDTQGERVATQAWIPEQMLTKIESYETQEENKEE